MFLDANSSITMHQLQVLREVFRSSTLQENRWTVFTYKMTFFIRTNLCSKKENGQISQGKKKGEKHKQTSGKHYILPALVSATLIFTFLIISFIFGVHPTSFSETILAAVLFISELLFCYSCTHGSVSFIHLLQPFFLRHRFIFNSFAWRLSNV